MTALTRFFFRSPYQRRSTLDVIEWWESRRPLYNVAVGIAGTMTLTTTTAFMMLFERPESLVVPWLPIVFYAILANVCYSIGPVVDMLICRKWGSQYDAIGPALFRYGFVFSVGLTLLPIPVVVFAGIMRMLDVMI